MCGGGRDYPLAGFTNHSLSPNSSPRIFANTTTTKSTTQTPHTPHTTRTPRTPRTTHTPRTTYIVIVVLYTEESEEAREHKTIRHDNEDLERGFHGGSICGFHDEEEFEADS